MTHEADVKKHLDEEALYKATRNVRNIMKSPDHEYYIFVGTQNGEYDLLSVWAPDPLDNERVKFFRPYVMVWKPNEGERAMVIEKTAGYLRPHLHQTGYHQ